VPANVTVVREVASEKAYGWIDVTLAGIVIDARADLVNAPSPMVVS
jgi:hypothetical protein